MWLLCRATSTPSGNENSDAIATPTPVTKAATAAKAPAKAPAPGRSVTAKAPAGRFLTSRKNLIHSVLHLAFCAFYITGSKPPIVLLRVLRAVLQVPISCKSGRNVFILCECSILWLILTCFGAMLQHPERAQQAPTPHQQQRQTCLSRH